MKVSKEFKIGLFVVVVIVASFFLINYLRGKDIFNREIELVSRYDNLEGLVASAPVYIKGYKAGRVASVEYNPETEDFTVVCSIMKEFSIPKDSYMTIYSVDIMGGKGVKINLGTSELMAENGDTLQPLFEAGLMDGLSASVGPLLEKVNKTMDSLAVTVAGVNRILSEENTASISRTLVHLEKTMQNVNSLAKSVNGKSDELNSLIENLNSISVKFVSISEKLDTTMNDVNSVVANISESDIQGLVSSFKELLENINDPDGTIGQLLVNDSMYKSIDELLNDVDILIKQIKENPKKYIRISIF